MNTTLPTAEQLALDWANNPRWAGIDARRTAAEDVVRLRGTVADRALARPARRREAVGLPARASPSSTRSAR